MQQIMVATTEILMDLILERFLNGNLKRGNDGNDTMQIIIELIMVI